MEYQHTIVSPVALSGKGLHTGKKVNLKFSPANIDTGIRFQRVDLPEKPIIKALISNVFDTSRGTSLKEGNAEVRTVEHVMAALAGLKIDNILIEIDAEETPIMDGSSRFFVEELLKAGLCQQHKERKYYVVQEPVSFVSQEQNIELMITPADKLTIEVSVDYGTSVLNKQTATMSDIDSFYPDFYGCRTFVFLHELQFLIEHNLVKGGDVDNAIVFVDKMPDQSVLEKLSVFFNKKNIKVTENGTLDNIEMNFPNEPARHKLLDIIGDIYLLGHPIKGNIVAKHPGHYANTTFARLIMNELEKK